MNDERKNEGGEKRWGEMGGEMKRYLRQGKSRSRAF